MWQKSYSKIYPNVTKEAVWRRWADVNNWPQWDKELEYCNLKGDFIEGNHFILKPIGGPKVKIFLSHVNPNKQFTDYCKFLGATMHDDHQLEDTDTGLKITNIISVTGLFTPLWVKLVAKHVANGVPTQMDALVELARKQ